MDKHTYKVPFYNTPAFTPLWKLSDKDKNTLHTIPAFSFTDQHGSTITQQTTAHKIYLANFFFASCSGICPRMMGTLSKVYAHFKNNNEILILSYTVDPDHDNPEMLKEYAGNNQIKENWLLLTGSKEAIYTLARKGYFIEQVMGYSKTTNDFLHSENIILVDKHKHIRGIYNGTVELDAEKMIADIEELLKED